MNARVRSAGGIYEFDNVTAAAAATVVVTVTLVA